MKYAILAIIGTLLLTGAASAQQRVQAQPTRATPAQPPANSIQAQDIEEAQDAFCVIREIYMSRGGMLFHCSVQDEDNLLVVFDGGNRPGGISAAMNLALWMKENEQGVQVRYQVNEDHPVCAQTPINYAYDCVEAISFGGF